MYRHVADEVNAMPEDCFAKKIVVSQYDEILEDLDDSDSDDMFSFDLSMDDDDI